MFVSLGMKEIKDSTSIQTSLFQPLTGLVGQQAFLVAKKVAMGQLTYEEAVAMVASEGELLDDISYINDL